MIGYTLRYFRKSKSLSLEYVAKDILTVSFLSKVERDLSDISVSNFILILEKLGINIVEFIHIYYYFSNNDNISISELQLLHANNNYDYLQSSFENNKNLENCFPDNKLYNIFISLILSNMKNTPISKSNINYVQNYLMSISNWTFCDLYLYCQSIKYYNHSTMITLSKLALKIYNHYYQKINFGFSINYMLLNNTILLCLERNDIENAEYFLNQLSKYKLDAKDYYHILKKKGLSALLEYKKGNKETALLDLKKIIDTHIFLTDFKTTYTQSYYTLSKILSKSELANVFPIK